MTKEHAIKFASKAMDENDNKLPIARSRHWLCFAYDPETDDIVCYDALSPARLINSLRPGVELVDLIGMPDARAAENAKAAWNVQAKSRRALLERHRADLASRPTARPTGA